LKLRQLGEAGKQLPGFCKLFLKNAKNRKNMVFGEYIWVFREKQQR